jgi:hypothetical protein
VPATALPVVLVSAPPFPRRAGGGAPGSLAGSLPVAEAGAGSLAGWNWHSTQQAFALLLLRLVVVPVAVPLAACQ